MNGSENIQYVDTGKYNEEYLTCHVEDSSRWIRSHPIDGECKPIDLRVIEPYKKVISHAGYYHQFNSVQLARNNLHTGKFYSLSFSLL